MAETRTLAARIAPSGPLATRGAKRITNLRATSGFAVARALSDALRQPSNGVTTSRKAWPPLRRPPAPDSPVGDFRARPYVDKHCRV
jgi:hypothetical protein